VIGAVGARALIDQLAQRAGGRVPVGVTGAHRGHDDPRADRTEEVGVLMITSMMRNLEHDGTQVGTRGEQRALGVLLHVAGQEYDGAAWCLQPQHERGVVRIAGRPVEGPLGSKHLPAGAAGPAYLSDDRLADGHMPAGGPAEDPPALDRGLVQRTEFDAADRPAAEHTGQPLHVVGVQVGEDDERHPPHTQPAEAGVDGSRVGAGVHDHSGVRPGGEDQGVALPHVAGHQEPAGWRPAGCQDRE